MDSQQPRQAGHHTGGAATHPNTPAVPPGGALLGREGRLANATLAPPTQVGSAACLLPALARSQGEPPFSSQDRFGSDDDWRHETVLPLQPSRADGLDLEEVARAEPVWLPTVLPLSRPEALDPSGPGQRLLAAFLAGRSPQTVRAYRQDLADFATFLGTAVLAEAAQRLLASGSGPANELALRYKEELLQRQLAAATVNRRLAALRSLVKLGRTLGLVGWSMEVEGLKAEPYRDTRGPGTAGFRRLLEQLAGRTDAKGVRDRALLRLLFDLGLRRSEVVRLDLADLDRERGTLAVLGKGRSSKVALTLPPQTQAALESWLAVRGLEAGPLFRSLDRARKGSGRLSGAGLYALVRRLGEQAGLKVWPHGLRHAAITQALDATGGDVRAVQHFSRHRDLRTLLLYDDRRADLAGDVARRVAAAA